MKTIKLNTEQFTDQDISNIQGLYTSLLKDGYKPKMIGIPTMTEATIEHNDDEGGRIKMLIIKRNGQLQAAKI